MGICRFSGKNFGQLIQHFISSGDDTCFMACGYGTLKVIGSADWKNDEKNTQYSRILVTVYRTGSVDGDMGPSMLLMGGKKQQLGYTDVFLKRNGAVEVPKIIMNETTLYKYVRSRVDGPSSR